MVKTGTNVKLYTQKVKLITTKLFTITVSEKSMYLLSLDFSISQGKLQLTIDTIVQDNLLF